MDYRNFRSSVTRMVSSDKINGDVGALMYAIKQRQLSEVEFRIKKLYLKENKVLGLEKSYFDDLFLPDFINEDDFSFLINKVPVSSLINIMMSMHNISMNGFLPRNPSYLRKARLFLGALSTARNDGPSFNRHYYSDSLVRFIANVYGDTKKAQSIYTKIVRLTVRNPVDVNFSAYKSVLFEVKHELNGAVTLKKLEFVSSTISLILAGKESFGLRNESIDDIFLCIGEAAEAINSTIASSRSVAINEKCKKIINSLAKRMNFHASAMINSINTDPSEEVATLRLLGKKYEGQCFVGSFDLARKLKSFLLLVEDRQTCIKIVDFATNLIVENGIMGQDSRDLASYFSVVGECLDWSRLLARLTDGERLLLIRSFKETSLYLPYLIASERGIAIRNDLGM
jgi:hypothetical protein